ncbi:sigma 54-interacting transcriptional regulator [Photobacterium nomapromontoriensis]|uniref:sigma 54-interacting transcriptional regulator n=1 Tax=Photobacterium nomapromontoriensis TaxID=2910237 RepID=UPI003D0D1490
MTISKEEESMDTLLVIEDDLGIQKQLKWHLAGYNLIFAENRQDAIAAVRRYEPKVVTLDLGLPPDQTNAAEGLKTLQEIIALTPHTKVIVITGNDEKKHALNAIEIGAHDFYHKPIDANILKVIIERAYNVINLEMESLKKQQSNYSEYFLIGSQIHDITPTIKRIAQADISTLITGEPGTGKKTVAREIHRQSERSNNPLVELNCSLISEDSIESELFGYNFNVQDSHQVTKAGLLEKAHGGILFIKEISLLPLTAQVRLLEYLRTKKIIHHKDERVVNVNVICTSSYPLQSKVKECTFLAELYVRLSCNQINIAPLRDRASDILLFANHFLQREKLTNKYKINGFTNDAITSMYNYDWPGNLSELDATIKSAILKARGKFIKKEDLSCVCNIFSDNLTLELNLRTARESVEKKAILQAISISAGNISKAAALLGITRPTLYALLEKYDLNANNA